MNSNFEVIGLTRLGIKPESTAQETDASYHSAIGAVKIEVQSAMGAWKRKNLRMSWKIKSKFI